MVPKKTEALLATDRRSFQYPRIVLGEDKVEWKARIKYLRVQLDQMFSFREFFIQLPTKPCYFKATVLSAERCCAENSLSI